MKVDYYAILRHDPIFKKVHTKSCRSNLSLHTLLKKEVEFKLKKIQLDAIRKLKLLVTNTPCLNIFNPNLQTHLKSDTWSEGSGALPEQNQETLIYPKWCLVGYVSWSLQDYKKCYAQIEKETLSINFDVERFHEYLYGCKFTMINDHQPLQSIFSKSIISCLISFFLRLTWNTDLEKQG